MATSRDVEFSQSVWCLCLHFCGECDNQERLQSTAKFRGTTKAYEGLVLERAPFYFAFNFFFGHDISETQRNLAASFSHSYSGEGCNEQK